MTGRESRSRAARRSSRSCQNTVAAHTPLPAQAAARPSNWPRRATGRIERPRSRKGRATADSPPRGIARDLDYDESRRRDPAEQIGARALARCRPEFAAARGTMLEGDARNRPAGRASPRKPRRIGRATSAARRAPPPAPAPPARLPTRSVPASSPARPRRECVPRVSSRLIASPFRIPRAGGATRTVLPSMPSERKARPAAGCAPTR